MTCAISFSHTSLTCALTQVVGTRPLGEKGERGYPGAPGLRGEPGPKGRQSTVCLFSLPLPPPPLPLLPFILPTFSSLSLEAGMAVKLFFLAPSLTVRRCLGALCLCGFLSRCPCGGYCGLCFCPPSLDCGCLQVALGRLWWRNRKCLYMSDLTSLCPILSSPFKVSLEHQANQALQVRALISCRMLHLLCGF